jgi:hypothetical protein
MQLRRVITAAAFLAALAASPHAVLAQSGNGYDLGWHSLVPGGVVGSSGGTYGLSGVVGATGQVMAQNNYVLYGGFWGDVFSLTAGVPAHPGLPKRFALYAPAPNPSPGAAALTFDLPREAHVSLLVFDVNGRVVRRLVDGTRAAGQYHLTWDGGTEAGVAAAPGIYLLDFRAGAFRATRRLVHL